MNNELQQNLDTILLDKNTNLKPENLKSGVTCLGITGTLQQSENLYRSLLDGYRIPVVESNFNALWSSAMLICNTYYEDGEIDINSTVDIIFFASLKYNLDESNPSMNWDQLMNWTLTLYDDSDQELYSQKITLTSQYSLRDIARSTFRYDTNYTFGITMGRYSNFQTANLLSDVSKIKKLKIIDSTI